MSRLVGGLPPARGSGLAWLVAVLLAVALLCGYELFWRGLGFRPSVSDNLDLWAYHRAKVYEGGDKALVLVGASSMVQDIDTALLRQLAPGRPITQLAVAARAPMATAIDLCRDQRFTGTVLLAARPLFFSGHFFNQQRGHVLHFHRTWLSPKTPVVLLRAWLGQRLIFPHPDMNVVFYQTALLRWLKNDTGPAPLIRQRIFDRSEKAYRSPDLIKFRQDRQRRRYVRRPVPSHSEDPAYVAEFKRRVDAVAEAAGQLRARGGTLVPILLPMSGYYRLNYERRFPREVFWDYIKAKLGPPAIDYADYAALESFPPPDGSHLEAKQTEGFTRALAKVLAELGVLGPVE